MYVRICVSEWLRVWPNLQHVSTTYTYMCMYIHYNYICKCTCTQHTVRVHTPLECGILKDGKPLKFDIVGQVRKIQEFKAKNEIWISISPAYLIIGWNLMTYPLHWTIFWSIMGWAKPMILSSNTHTHTHTHTHVYVYTYFVGWTPTHPLCTCIMCIALSVVHCYVGMLVKGLS